eukprot:CAMPEP_0204841070 /NCGR_PEP_ID=MMETSP1346-20131115/40471_1 /ASSEMBLY_ACC=CAM_ASM_000771 /TAXON_ID=215587 /ORGANISM="Aplanochytrium stocchinoi, Strain GSBS06" /LENGTH=64 /DNA_ID=CAMNT_0051978943 /DNA_START=136 /DNA_END=327 /DNA_ORIENTATION=-
MTPFSGGERDLEVPGFIDDFRFHKNRNKPNTTTTSTPTTAPTTFNPLLSPLSPLAKTRSFTLSS